MESDYEKFEQIKRHLQAAIEILQTPFNVISPSLTKARAEEIVRKAEEFAYELEVKAEELAKKEGERLIREAIEEAKAKREEILKEHAKEVEKLQKVVGDRVEKAADYVVSVVIKGGE